MSIAARERVEKSVAALSALTLVYFLAAPPVFLILVDFKHADALFNLFRPVFLLLTSAYGEPLIWYFNSVWNAGIMPVAKPAAPAWVVLPVYGAVVALLLGAVMFPFRKRVENKSVLDS